MVEDQSVHTLARKQRQVGSGQQDPQVLSLCGVQEKFCIKRVLKEIRYVCCHIPIGLRYREIELAKLHCAYSIRKTLDVCQQNCEPV